MPMTKTKTVMATTQRMTTASYGSRLRSSIQVSIHAFTFNCASLSNTHKHTQTYAYAHTPVTHNTHCLVSNLVSFCQSNRGGGAKMDVDEDDENTPR
jgi:hypothetical protein